MEVVIRRRGGQWLIQETLGGHILFRKNEYADVLRVVDVCEMRVLGVERSGAWRDQFTPYF